MSEPPPVPPRLNTSSRKNLLIGILGFCLLLVVDIVVLSQIFRRGLIPAFASTATPTEVGTPLVETAMLGTPLQGSVLIEKTLTSTPMAEPTMPETPMPETTVPIDPILLTAIAPSSLSTTPSPTPVYESCQYTLKPGKKDFLNSIYRIWRIYKNIPNLQDYYDGISCAGLLTNLECDYHPDDPDTTQSGWILILPGVSLDICSLHGGTPIP